MLVPSRPRVDPNPWSGGVVWLVIEFPRHTLACQMNAYDDHTIDMNRVVVENMCGG